MKPIDKKLLVIVIAQFFCTSLWFAGNVVVGDLVKELNLGNSVVGHLTSAVQFGFIAGTLIFALLMIVDRFSPSKVFFTCAILAGGVNLLMLLQGINFSFLLLVRFLIGFFLAGIYPVGMKIAADYFENGLGRAMSFIVGALVLGTAFPHFIKAVSFGVSVDYIIYATSFLAFIGGVSMSFIPDGPFRIKNSRPDFKIVAKVFRKKAFRLSAIGYFGHMWELYTFWAFVPVILTLNQKNNSLENLNVPLWSFLIIGIGSLSCVVFGMMSKKYSVNKLVVFILSGSVMLSLASPMLFLVDNLYFVLGYLLVWGVIVIADSPLLSTLMAQNTDSASKGTSLTIANSIGYALTIISIQILSILIGYNPGSPYLFMILGVGPIVGLYAVYKLKE